MTNGTAPSAIAGNTLPEPSSGALLQFIMPHLMSMPSYTDLAAYWSPRRDWQLQATINNREDMWAAAVAKTATKFAAHGFTIKDTQDSQRKVSASQELLKRANGGEGWVLFAQKVIQDLLLTDNGVFIRIRRQNEETHKIRVKEQTIAGGEKGTFDEAAVTLSPPGAKIIGLYHLDSLRCTRTGNLAYPVRYMTVMGQWQILRWDQVLMYADQPSSRAELFGVGRCAADRSYNTISKISAMERLDFEALTGGGANKLALIRGIVDQTLQGIIATGQNSAQAKGWLYYLGTILGAVPGDQELQLLEVRLKEVLDGFKPKESRDNAYVIYANNIGTPVQDIQPLSGQGLGTGTQTIVLQEAAQGQGAMPTFIKWWEQTVSDRVLPATTELEFTDENDVRDQKQRAEVQKMRADTRAVQIQSGEISPAMSRQLAVDSEDLPREFIADDATAGGQISDDEKMGSETQHINPAILSLIQSAPTTPPKQQQGQPGVATKTYNHNWTQALNAAVQAETLTEAQADELMYGTTTKATAIADLVARYKALSDEAKALGLEPSAWMVKDAADDLFETELGWAKRLGREARKRG